MLFRHESVRLSFGASRHPRTVPAAAPRISPRLVAVIVRATRERVPFAEIARRVGREADRLGLSRPSYEQVRVLAHEAIEHRERRRELAGSLADAAFDPLIVRQLTTLGRVVEGVVDEAGRAVRDRRRRSM